MLVFLFLGWGWGDRGRAFDGILALFLFIYSLHVIVDFSWSFFLQDLLAMQF